METQNRILLAPQTVYVVKSSIPKKLRIGSREKLNAYQYQYAVRPANPSFSDKYNMIVFFCVELKEGDFIVLDDGKDGISEMIMDTDSRKLFYFRKVTPLEVLQIRKELRQ